jgi:hypothetical protein
MLLLTVLKNEENYGPSAAATSWFSLDDAMGVVVSEDKYTSTVEKYSTKKHASSDPTLKY